MGAGARWPGPKVLERDAVTSMSMFQNKKQPNIKMLFIIKKDQIENTYIMKITVSTIDFCYLFNWGARQN